MDFLHLPIQIDFAKFQGSHAIMDTYRNVNGSYIKRLKPFNIGDPVKYLGSQGWVYGIVKEKRVPSLCSSSLSHDYCSVLYCIELKCGQKMEIPTSDPWLTYYNPKTEGFLFDGWPVVVVAQRPYGDGNHDDEVIIF